MTRVLSLVLAMSWWSAASRTVAQDNAQLEIGGGTIDIALSSAPAEPLRKLVLEWVASSAHAVTVYYEKFPVSNLQLRVRIFDGHGVRGGRTTGWDGAAISIAVGSSSTASDFAEDWVLTHEMMHLAFPSVADEHHWIEEGSATYIEPIARALAGDLTPEKVWGDLVDGLPQGLPEPGDRGLDLTPTWGRTYWGGALFCFLADIETRKRTGNKKGLEDALRAIVNAGGTVESEWPIARALEIGDRATGVPVLRELYDKMKAAPASVDLKALWKELGVECRGPKIEFNDAAPLAAIRKAITKRTAR
ncbi:MAG: hypothetical protein ABJB22_03005 [Verrucomicrobiota bacterium]